MTDLKEVLEFIKNSDQSQINQIRESVSIRRSELDFSHKSSFSVGDIVGIDHKKIPSSVDFRIIKINNKNIKVQGVDDLFNVYTVSPSLLVKR
tara:strand:- start:1870 stop:2148 length:279 start_codon:yes stop_codon:yes gene_type:complete